ncbi:3-oxoacyl-ACP reductase FabG [Leifsonia bigeumensis]|uniref:3-oxoacyl-ACP reductase FabG n=1 Tax=Leifsonella bigeumensis TaxID=433643 RepID=A0ABP7FH56_9MICO
MSTEPDDLHDHRPVDDMRGKSILVTGAAQGLGQVIARQLAARGVVVAALDIQDTGRTVDLIEAEGGRALRLRGDVTVQSSIEEGVNEIVSTTGRIDGLVNCAALFTTLQRRPFMELDLGEWERALAVNATSVLLCTRAVAPRLVAQRAGAIVNIASNVVSYGASEFLQYVSSKSAIIGITRGLARELGDHLVRVNTVSPGMVTTDITVAQHGDEYRKRVIDTQCIKEPIRPRDIAEVVSFLLSDASRYITGQNILVNAGSHMGPA